MLWRRFFADSWEGDALQPQFPDLALDPDEWPPPSPKRLAELRHLRRQQFRDVSLSTGCAGLLAAATFWIAAPGPVLASLRPLIAGLFVVAGAAVSAFILTRRVLPGQAQLLDSPNDPTESVVVVKVEVGGVVRGADRGVLWIEEQSLYFHGERIWFRIARQDFQFHKTGTAQRGRQPELVERGGLSIAEVRTDGPKVRLGFVTAPLTKLVLRDPGKELLKAFQENYLSSPMPTRLPPLSFDPYYRDAGSLAMFGFVSLIMAADLLLLIVQAVVVMRGSAHSNSVELTTSIGLLLAFLPLVFQLGTRGRGAVTRLRARWRMRKGDCGWRVRR